MKKTRPGRREAADRRAAEAEEAALRRAGFRFLSPEEARQADLDRRVHRYKVLDGKWLWPHPAHT